MRRNPVSTLTGFMGALALLSALAVVPTSAAGQTGSSVDGQMQANPSEENCQVEPRNKPPAKKDDQTGSVTKKLGKCGGVLQPPDVNDPGLVKPAPDTGEMPVIKPHQVPQQAPKQK
jgi:hypothetical protein